MVATVASSRSLASFNDIRLLSKNAMLVMCAPESLKPGNA